jgi:hypothetical protein
MPSGKPLCCYVMPPTSIPSHRAMALENRPCAAGETMQRATSAQYHVRCRTLQSCMVTYSILHLELVHPGAATAGFLTHSYTHAHSLTHQVEPPGECLQGRKKGRAVYRL